MAGGAGDSSMSPLSEGVADAEGFFPAMMMQMNKCCPSRVGSVNLLY